MREGQKVLINHYDTVDRPKRITRLAGKQGRITHIFRNGRYLVEVYGINYDVSPESLDEVEDDPLLHVVLKQWEPNIWDLYYNGRRYGVRNPQLLNLRTLRHELIGERQQDAITEELFHGLTNYWTGWALAEKHEDVLSPVSNHKRAVMAHF